MASKTSLIVGAIDFGTTYSGYAFSFRHQFEEDPTKIQCNTWTSGASQLMSLKTPTCALFDPDKKFVSFGFEAEDKYTDLAADNKHTDWYYFRQFKMDLFEKLKLKRTFTLKDTLGKTMPAIDVFSASIGYLKRHLVKKCKDRFPDTRDKDIKWVVTVPAIWDDAAKQFMRECAIQAGIDNDRLVIALEAEAASLFCRHLKVDRFSGMSAGLSPFRPGSKYLVSDAGGGTIDITVHKVQANRRIAELYKASGGDWGGIYVDKAFNNFICDIVGRDVLKAFIKENTESYLELMGAFEVKKRSLAPTLSSKVRMKVPMSLNDCFKRKTKKYIGDILGSTKYANRVSWSKDKLSIDADIFKEIFSGPCSSIIKHLEKIFDKPQLEDVDTILMVGGFSESQILQDQIRKHFGNKTIIVPEDAGLVVLKGAVIFGHNSGAITLRKCKYTYGIRIRHMFIEGKHPPEKAVVTDDGVRMCRKIFSVHVRTGDTVQTGKPQDSQNYTVVNADQTQTCIPVYASKKRHPTFTDEKGCLQVGEMTIMIEGSGMDRSAKVQLEFGDTELHVSATSNQTGEITSAKFNFLALEGDGETDENSPDSSDSEGEEDRVDEISNFFLEESESETDNSSDNDSSDDDVFSSYMYLANI